VAPDSFYVGGPVPPDSDAYVERSFVQECFDELAGGKWVVLLGPRQHGKTSGLRRLAALLEGANVNVAQVSLQGVEISTYSDLLEWVARRIARQLNVRLEAPAEADRSELDAWLAAALPEEPAQIALLLDEAAAIRDDSIRGTFYHQLRRLHDERDNPRVRNLGRSLGFLFSGTFQPKRLVADDLASPFNVSRTTETLDLSKEEIAALAQRLDAEEALPYVEDAFELVGGQPFLIQHLLGEAERGDSAIPAAERFEKAKNRLLAGDSEHLSNLLSSILNDQPVREIVQEMLANDGAPFVATPAHRMVITIGFGRLDGSRLAFRNPLYRQVASQHPLLGEGPPQPSGTQLAPAGAGSLSFIRDESLRTIAEEMLEAGYDASNRGHSRMALIGLGSALEAILIDLLEHASDTELTQAKNKAQAKFKGREDKADPATWNLPNLIKVADKLPALSNTPVTAAQAVRELRNYVHPALARNSGIAQQALQSEFEAANGVLRVLMREIE
jgi:AAA domain-containing protein